VGVSWEPTVAVIVPCFNVERVVARCLESLLAQDYPESRLQLVVVDDGSRDRTWERLQPFRQAPGVTLLRHERNRGLAAARNTGIRAGDSEVVGFLDSDMVVAPDWLRRLLAVLADAEVVGVLGENRLPAGMTPNRLDRYLYSQRRGARQHGDRKPLGFPWFLFHNTALKRAVLDRVGLFDETIATYGGEDTDLAIRIWEAYPQGLRFVPQAVAEHHHQRSVAAFCAAMEQYGYTNLPRLLERYPHHRRALAGDWIHSLKGRLLFNWPVRWVVKSTANLLPLPSLIRYQVVDSVVRGARRYYRHH
jgi:glycosyltransferase involved in cell wall biosynthesis